VRLGRSTLTFCKATVSIDENRVRIDMENKFVSSKELEEARLKRQEEWKKAFERIGESIVKFLFF